MADPTYQGGPSSCSCTGGASGGASRQPTTLSRTAELRPPLKETVHIEKNVKQIIIKQILYLKCEE